MSRARDSAQLAFATMVFRFALGSTRLAVVACAAALSCSAAPPPSVPPEEVAMPTPSVEALKPEQPPPPPQEPFVLTPVAIARGDLVVTSKHLYWLETRFRAGKPRRSGASSAARGLLGFGAALQCDDAGGASIVGVGRERPSPSSTIGPSASRSMGGGSIGREHPARADRGAPPIRSGSGRGTRPARESRPPSGIGTGTTSTS